MKNRELANGMTESAQHRIRAQSDPLGRLFAWLADAAAIAGGVILTCMIVMTVASIVGRALAGLGNAIAVMRVFGPVPGDFEIMSMAGAVAVAAFMPLCQQQAGHVVVDLLFRDAGPRARAAISCIGHALFVAVGALIVRSVYGGMADKLAYGETTMLLRLPAWWGYAGVMGFFALAVLIALYLAACDLRRAFAATGSR